MKTILLAAIVLVAMSGCCHRSVKPPVEARVGTYVSKPAAFSTSSYWLEGPTGLILIDTQFLFSSAEEMVNQAEKATGKKAVLAIVLHPNPDKFNGSEIFQKRGIPVVTSEQARELIPTVHEDRHHWFYDRYKPDYPNLAPLLESFGATTRELEAGGLKVKVHVLGAGCSEAHVVVEFEGHVFVGDLVANRHHSWLEIGKTDEWLKRLAEIRALNPRYVHPGRGANGGIELLDAQQTYLNRVIELVARAQPSKGRRHRVPTEAAIARIQVQLEKDYPGYGNSYFLELGIPAEWERQARLRHY